MPTVEKNSNVHWLGNCISFDSTSSNKQHSAKKIPDYNIANFDVLKLPVFRGMFLQMVAEICFSLQLQHLQLRYRIDVRDVVCWMTVHCYVAFTKHGTASWIPNVRITKLLNEQSK